MTDILHELVFTDRESRPAKWETRCGRTDVPLEDTGSADPGMYYPVTCKACLRMAELETLLGQLITAVDPAKLQLLANWFDVDDEMKQSAFWPSPSRDDPEVGTEVQDWLRATSDLVNGAADTFLREWR